MGRLEFNIAVKWDEEAKVWWVERCSVPGVHLEDDDPWKLIQQAVEVSPELVALNARP